MHSFNHYLEVFLREHANTLWKPSSGNHIPVLPEDCKSKIPIGYKSNIN